LLAESSSSPLPRSLLKTTGVSKCLKEAAILVYNDISTSAGQFKMKAATISHRLLSCFQIYNLVSSVGRNRFHRNRRAILRLPSVSQLFTAYLLLEVVLLAFKLTRCRYLVHVTIVTVCCLCHSVSWSAQDRALGHLGHSTSFVIVGLVWAASCGLILPILAGAIRRPPFLIRVVRTACSSVVDTADAFYVKLGQDA